MQLQSETSAALLAKTNDDASADGPTHGRRTRW